jgi:hypothetical protein
MLRPIPGPRGAVVKLMITSPKYVSLCDSTYPTRGRAEGEAEGQQRTVYDKATCAPLERANLSRNPHAALVAAPHCGSHTDAIGRVRVTITLPLAQPCHAGGSYASQNCTQRETYQRASAPYANRSA